MMYDNKGEFGKNVHSNLQQALQFPPLLFHAFLHVKAYITLFTVQDIIQTFVCTP